MKLADLPVAARMRLFIGMMLLGLVTLCAVRLDDVDREFCAIALTLGGILLALLALMGPFGWRISESVTGQLGGEPPRATAVIARRRSISNVSPAG